MYKAPTQLGATGLVCSTAPVSIGKRAYDVVKPLLDQSSLGKQVSGGVAKGLMDYNRLRGDVLSGFDKTHSLLGSLKKAVPEIRL